LEEERKQLETGDRNEKEDRNEDLLQVKEDNVICTEKKKRLSKKEKGVKSRNKYL